MIKTALKHWIYEICIDQLFNGISKNFSIDKNIFRKGKMFEYIKSIPKDHDIKYRKHINCKIVAFVNLFLYSTYQDVIFVKYKNKKVSFNDETNTSIIMGYDKEDKFIVISDIINYKEK